LQDLGHILKTRNLLKMWQNIRAAIFYTSWY